MQAALQARRSRRLGVGFNGHGDCFRIAYMASYSQSLTICILAVLSMVSAPPFAAAQSNSPPTNQLQFLVTSREALQARVDLVFADGPHNLDVSTYVILEDNVGLALIAGAVRSVRSGGRARIAYDAYESRLSSELVSYAVSQGVEMKSFRPIVNDISHPIRTLKSWIGINNRNHEKLFLVDSAAAIVGSSNLSEDYYLAARKRVSPDKWRFKDREVMIAGPTVAKIQETFDRKWNDRDFEPLDRCQRCDAGKIATISATIESTIQKLDAIRNQKNFQMPQIAIPEGVDYEADEAKLLRKSQAVHSRIIGLVESAKNSLILENPYIVLPADLMQAIVGAAKRGVHVELYTNNPGGTDGGDVGMASVPDFAKLAAAGVKIHFYELNDVFHGKVIIADQENIFWGSYNFDNRSKSFNLENGLFFKSFALNKQLESRRNDEAFRPHSMTVSAGQLFAVPDVRTCEEIFTSSAISGYKMRLSPLLKLKRPLL